MASIKFKNRSGQWIELVVDNLTTESAIRALSAKQGKILQTTKADKSTTLAGYGIADAYTKTEIDALIAAVFKYQGVKATVADVEAVQNPRVGDVWFVTADGSEYAWNGTVWEKLGPVIDLSHFITSLTIAGLTLDVSNTSITAAQLRTALSIYTRAETDTLLADKVDKTTKINGHALSGDVDVTKGDVGLGNVDNTSDTDKPVSTAQQEALNLKFDKENVDDTAGSGDTDKVWSANKTAGIVADIKAGTEAKKDYHIGFYIDSDGDLCQKD